VPGDPFLCPVCSARHELPGGERVVCPTCRNEYGLPLADRLARTLGRIWNPEERDAEACARRAAESLRAEGLVVHPLDAQKIDLPDGRGLRLLLTEGDRTGHALVAAVGGAWSEELELAALNLLLPLSNHLETKGTPPRFRFLAPLPLPPALRYVFGTTLQGRFERLALAQTGLYDPAVPVDPAEVDALTELAATLVEACFDRVPKGEGLEDASMVETLVLSWLRFPLGPEEKLPEGAYTPASSLLLLGLLAGRAICRAGHPPIGWAADPGAYFGLQLSVRMRSVNAMGTANVVGKLFKLYRNGLSDSVEFLARHVVDESRP
jgi:hypothetical protein